MLQVLLVFLEAEGQLELQALLRLRGSLVWVYWSRHCAMVEELLCRAVRGFEHSQPGRCRCAHYVAFKC